MSSKLAEAVLKTKLLIWMPEAVTPSGPASACHYVKDISFKFVMNIHNTVLSRSSELFPPGALEKAAEKSS